MATGASRIFVEQVREADRIVNSQPSSGASQIFVERYINALAILREEADAGGASQIFVERVREAATILGINISPGVGQTFALDFDGVTEYMASSGSQLLGIANAWSIEEFFNLDDPNNKSDGLFNCGTPIQGANSITIVHEHLPPTGPFGIQIILENSAGSVFKNFAWVNVLASGGGVWEHFMMTWDGTTLKLYVGGVDQGLPTMAFTDNPGTQTDTSRGIRIMNGNLSRGPAEGLNAVGSMWSTVLSAAEITELAGAFSQDRTVDGTNYVSSATVQHHWRFGDKLSPLLGEDLGVAAVLIDMEAGAVGITDANRIENVPAT